MTFPATASDNTTVQLLTGAELTAALSAITTAVNTLAPYLDGVEGGLGALLTAVNSPSGTQPLPTGAATAAGVAAVVTALGTVAQVGGKVDTVIQATATNKSATVGTTASALIAANASRRGFSVQNQSTTATIYINGVGTAVADSSSLAIAPGQLYETPVSHVGTGAISVISTAAATPVYAREF